MTAENDEICKNEGRATRQKPPPTKPAFCIVAPTAYLTRYAVQSTCHFVLARLVASDIEYRAFYKSMAKHPQNYIIMDHGPVRDGKFHTLERIFELGDACGADAIVLPDFPNCPVEKTIEAAKEFGPSVKEAGFHTMFAPHGESGDLEGFVSSYKWAVGNPGIDMIGMSILGIPDALPHIPAAYARVVMTQILLDRGVFGHSKYHHYLGLGAGPKLEIPSLLRMRALNSIDSCEPVWAGLLGHEYTRGSDSFSAISKIKMPMDFQYEMSNDQQTLRRVQHNIDLTMSLLDESIP